MTGIEADNLIQSCKGDLPVYANRMDTKDTLKLWLAHFGDKDYGLMKTAILLCQGTVKGFPQVSDIKNAIKELQRDLNTQPKYKALNKRDRSVLPEVQNALRAVAEGRSKEIIASIDISDVYGYAKAKFRDISEPFVRINYLELLEYKESNDRCFGCQHVDGKCDTAGYYIVPVILPDGTVKNEYARCGKGRQAS